MVARRLPRRLPGRYRRHRRRAPGRGDERRWQRSPRPDLRRSPQLPARWSPDGGQIVFRRQRPGVDLSGDIWIMGADGSSPHPLIAQPGDERYPSLSPDGRRLAFTSHPIAADDVEIAVADLDSGGATAITDNAEFDSSPSWSPDGRRIAFERGAGDDPGNEVWSMAMAATAATSAGSRRRPGSTRARPGRRWIAHRVHQHPFRHQRHLDDGRRRTDQQPLAALPGTRSRRIGRRCPPRRPRASSPRCRSRRRRRTRRSRLLACSASHDGKRRSTQRRVTLTRTRASARGRR